MTSSGKNVVRGRPFLFWKCVPKGDWHSSSARLLAIYSRALNPFAKKNLTTRVFFHLRSAGNFSAARREVSISAHLTTMPRSSRNSKKAHITVFNPRRKKSSTGSFVVLEATKTRRGKTIYTEVDAAPYYRLSKEGGETPKKRPSKTPSNSITTVPLPLEDTFQGEASFLDNQEPHVPRITKVRLR